MENNNRIYQLSNEQLNTISSDLIEAIVLLSGKKNQKGLIANLHESKTAIENLVADTIKIIQEKEDLNDNLEKIIEELEKKEQDLRVKSDDTLRDMVLAMENGKKENLEKLEKRNQSYISQIENLNKDLKNSYENLNENLAVVQKVNKNIEQNHKNFIKDFDKKHSILIIFSMSLVFVSSFIFGFFVKHQLMMSQLKSSVPLSTFQSVLPFLKPFF